MEKRERVTWIRVVSRVAMVDSITATISNSPPGPGSTRSPSSLKMLSLVAISLGVSSMLVVIVKTSKRTNTMPTPISPASPEVFRLLRVSSLRLLVTSQPQ